MNPIIIIAAALLPAILLLAYILRKDPQPEPRARLAVAIGYGVFICLPISFIEYAVNTLLFGENGDPTTLLGTTVMSFLVAALPEEGLKLWALWRVLRHNPYYDEHFDGIVYAVCIGLAFAAVENVSYLFMFVDDWQQVAISRALLAVPGHYAFAVLMGYYYSLYHFVDRSPRTKLSILLVPVAAHGVYDALAMSGTVSPVLGGISFFVLVYFCVKLHKESQQKILAQLQRDEQQPPVV